MSDVMARMSVGGAANELIGETTESAVSARGDATATASGADGDGATTTVDGEATKDDDDGDDERAASGEASGSAVPTVSGGLF